MTPFARTLAFLALSIPAAASAQGGTHGGDGVAHSGMEQGDAHITTHTGITLSLDPVPGTSTARVHAMGHAVETRMTAIRACYHTVVARRPTVTGVLRMEITLAAGHGAPTITVTEDNVHDDELLTCARDALVHLPTEDIDRPAAVIAVLTLANTAAAGTAITTA